ncbi:MAG: hypothetical protein ABSB54_05835 [Acidimicrobiales bacterium]
MPLPSINAATIAMLATCSLADACADSEENVHRFLMENVLPRHATISTAAEWAATISK